MRGLALRHGHRLQRIDGEHEVTTRVSNRARKDTLIARPVHPDALTSFKVLSGIEDQLAIAQAVADAEEEVENQELEDIQMINDDFNDGDDVDDQINPLNIEY